MLLSLLFAHRHYSFVNPTKIRMDCAMSWGFSVPSAIVPSPAIACLWRSFFPAFLLRIMECDAIKVGLYHHSSASVMVRSRVFGLLYSVCYVLLLVYFIAELPYILLLVYSTHSTHRTSHCCSSKVSLKVSLNSVDQSVLKVLPTSCS